MKDLYTDNYKILIKEIKDDGKIAHALELGELILRWSYYPKQSMDLMWSYQITHNIFHNTRTNNPKIYIEPQKTQNCQSNHEEKNKARDFRKFLQSYSNQNNMVLPQK